MLNHDIQHKLLLDNLSTATLLMDKELRLVYLNLAAESLLGMSASRVLKQPISQLFSENGQPIDGLQNAMATGVPFTKRHTELRLPLPRDIAVDYTVTPISAPIDSGCLIMEIQPLDRMLSISSDASQLASQQATQLIIRGLAHEIKNPLGGLRGAAQLLARELVGQGMDEYTDIIIEEADRLRNLVDQLLIPSQAPQPTAVNIHEVTERVRTLVEAETQGTITIIRDYDPSLPDLIIDKEQMIQAVLNITRNAMQALENQSDGRITLRTRAHRQFTIGSKRHQLVCALEIIDNGPGIPPAIAEKIFFPMVTGRATGNGLGLSISQAIISQHSGLIKCSSEPGLTKFSLYLPLELQHEKSR